MASRAAVRASDVDRERVAERLRQAAGEGRLLTEELEERLEASFSARTYGQLDAIVADLPGPRLTPSASPRRHTWVRPALARAIAVPVTLAVVALVVFVVTGVLAMWMLWLAAGWWFFGRRRHRYGPRYGRSLHACGGWQRTRGRPRAQS
jgi:hypothetical protein